MGKSISTLFYRIAEYHKALNLPPLSETPHPWKFAIGDFRFTVNSSNATVDNIPPFHAAVTSTKYLAVLLVGPGGGLQIGAGMEDDVIAALDGAIAEARK